MTPTELATFPPRRVLRAMDAVKASGARIGVIVLVAGLPLVGATFSGREMPDIWRFPPPLNVTAGYTQFSWAAAAAVIAVLVATLAPWLRPRRDSSPCTESRQGSGERFPWWGIVAVGWLLAWWTLAWTRWPWFASAQRYTFFPLWIALVVAVNALTHMRTGSCLLCRAPRRWLALFGVSAGCWWSFEWLNRFARNWHYLNVEDHGAIEYALHATASFSTVLPAMAAIAEWLESHEGWRRVAGRGPRWRWLAGRSTGAILALTGMVALLGAGAMPQWFYPALWIAPLALLLAVPSLLRRQGLADEIATGDWRRAATWMTAALLCGFLWEMWNWRSLAKWIYTVPGVERWYLFEMPALGYVGYLPFGLECLLVTEWAIGSAWRSSSGRDRGKQAA